MISVRVSKFDIKKEKEGKKRGFRMGKGFHLIIISIFSALIGVYLIVESFVLHSGIDSMNGYGVSFHPFGLNLFIPNEMVTSTSIKTFVFGSLFVIVSFLLLKLKELQTN
jgi:hypothetical protein